METHLYKCKLIELPRFSDERGALTPIEGPPLIPFVPKRLYYIYDVHRGARRGCHSHRTEEELIIALAGSFKVSVNDGVSSTEFHLDRPDRALYIPPRVWHEVHSFSSGSVCAVLASEPYNPSDYCNSYQEFLSEIRRRDR